MKINLEMQFLDSDKVQNNQLKVLKYLIGDLETNKVHYNVLKYKVSAYYSK